MAFMEEDIKTYSVEFAGADFLIEYISE